MRVDTTASEDAEQPRGNEDARENSTAALRNLLTGLGIEASDQNFGVRRVRTRGATAVTAWQSDSYAYYAIRTELATFTEPEAEGSLPSDVFDVYPNGDEVQVFEAGQRGLLEVPLYGPTRSVTIADGSQAYTIIETTIPQARYSSEPFDPDAMVPAPPVSQRSH